MAALGGEDVPTSANRPGMNPRFSPAIKFAAALGNTPEFWLNIQHAVEVWDVRHNAYEQMIASGGFYDS